MKKYQIIYADPPWELRYCKETKEGFRVYDLPYPQMTDKEIMELPVKDWLADDAILFLWLIDSRIPIISKLMQNWGFQYKTVGFVWHKASLDGTSQNPTIGSYTRKSCEFCFIGTRGKSIIKRHTQNQFQQYLPLAKTKHSQKPSVIRHMIVEMCGDLPRLEMFAREKVDGWDIWGNELENSIELREVEMEKQKPLTEGEFENLVDKASQPLEPKKKPAPKEAETSESQTSDDCSESHTH